jgi:uncharacterized protein
MKNFAHQYPVWSYLIGAFSITYLFWFLPVIVEISEDLSFALMLLGGMGPLVSALVVSSLRSNSSLRLGSGKIFLLFFLLLSLVLFLRIYFNGFFTVSPNKSFPDLETFGIGSIVVLLLVFALYGFNISQVNNKNLHENYIRSFFVEKGKLKWYLIAFGVIPFIFMSSYGLGWLFGLPLTDFFLKISTYVIIGFFSVFLMTGGNEEFGWRGFMQKELQKKYNPLLTAFVISFFWSLWHLPLHYNGFYSYGGFADLLPRFVWLFPLTIVFSWLYNRSSYSILAVCIAHAMLNTFSGRLGSSPTLAWIIFGLVVIYCIIDDKMWKTKEYHKVYDKN